MEVVLPVIAGSISRCTLLKSYQLIMHITPPTPMQERIFFRSVFPRIFFLHTGQVSLSSFAHAPG